MQRTFQWRPRPRVCIATWPQNSSSSCWTACWSRTTSPRPSTPTTSRGPYCGKQVGWRFTSGCVASWDSSGVMYHNGKIQNFCDCLRFQRKVEAQPVEAGDQQPGVWPAHPVSHVHRWEPPGRLGGGPETTAQVSNKHVMHSYPTAAADPSVVTDGSLPTYLYWYLIWILSKCSTSLKLFWQSSLQLIFTPPVTVPQSAHRKWLKCTEMHLSVTTTLAVQTPLTG